MKIPAFLIVPTIQFLGFFAVIFTLRPFIGHPEPMELDWLITGTYGLLIFSGVMVATITKKVRSFICLFAVLGAWFCAAFVSYFDTTYIFQDPFIWLGVATVCLYNHPYSRSPTILVNIVLSGLIMISSSIALGLFGTHSPIDGAYTPFIYFQNLCLAVIVLYTSGAAVYHNKGRTDEAPKKETRTQSGVVLPFDQAA